LQTELDTLQTELATLKQTAINKADYEKKLSELQENLVKNKDAFEKLEIQNKKKFALQLHLRDAEAKHPELLENLFKKDNDWSFELDENEKIKDWENVLNPIKTKYEDSFGKPIVKGFDPNKGKQNLSTLTQERIMAMSDSELIENHEQIKEFLKQ
jgi:hypothetical protein